MWLFTVTKLWRLVIRPLRHHFRYIFSKFWTDLHMWRKKAKLFTLSSVRLAKCFFFVFLFFLSRTYRVCLKNAESKHFIDQIGKIGANEIDLLCNTALWFGDNQCCLYHPNILDLSTKRLLSIFNPLFILWAVNIYQHLHFQSNSYTRSV